MLVVTGSTQLIQDLSGHPIPSGFLRMAAQTPLCGWKLRFSVHVLVKDANYYDFAFHIITIKNNMAALRKLSISWFYEITLLSSKRTPKSMVSCAFVALLFVSGYWRR